MHGMNPELLRVERERTRIKREQKIEQVWWSHRDSYQTDRDVAEGIARETLIPIEGTRWFRISERCKSHYRALDPIAAKLLEAISRSWAHKMQTRRLSTERTFLVVTSMVRPTEYQRMLELQGLPAISPSSHERGLAFDIGTAWFAGHYPEALKALRDVLENERRHEFLNAIDEPELGIVHIAASPLFGHALRPPICRTFAVPAASQA